MHHPEFQHLPEFIIPASDMNHLGSSSVVFPLSTVPEFVYVYLPKVLVHDADLVHVTEIGPMPGHETEVPTSIERDGYLPWLKIPSASFGTIPGKQMYRMTFQENNSTRSFDLYFSVIIQNDNPDKPYVYMKRDAQNV